jgi:phosphoenolpyruvate carboxylase
MKKERKKSINQIKDKLTANRAMTSKADKSNSIIITYKDEYHRKIMSFISNNNFTIVKKMILLRNPQKILEVILTNVN